MSKDKMTTTNPIQKAAERIAESASEFLEVEDYGDDDGCDASIQKDDFGKKIESILREELRPVVEDVRFLFSGVANGKPYSELGPVRDRLLETLNEMMEEPTK